MSTVLFLGLKRSENPSIPVGTLAGVVIMQLLYGRLTLLKLHGCSFLSSIPETHGGKRELIRTGCHLTSTHVLNMYMPTYIHTLHKIN